MSRDLKLKIKPPKTSGRGRPRKSESEESKRSSSFVPPVLTTIPASRGRGRPFKAPSQSSLSESSFNQTAPALVLGGLVGEEEKESIGNADRNSQQHIPGTTSLRKHFTSMVLRSNSHR